jgi:hypothetical protein
MKTLFIHGMSSIQEAILQSWARTPIHIRNFIYKDLSRRNKREVSQAQPAYQVEQDVYDNCGLI